MSSARDDWDDASLGRTVLAADAGPGGGVEFPMLSRTGGPVGDPARYAFRSVLGEGGMGRVELRRDERIGRDVAFKVAALRGRDAVARTQATQRFMREAMLQARLEHPSFVPVYDVGVDESSEPFFTMRRIRGLTLGDILAGHAAGGATRFTMRRLLGAFTQLCLSVDYAHSRGVVHRDLKPDNVMLGDFGEIYVLDWGIAKVMGEREDLPAVKTGATEESPISRAERERRGPDGSTREGTVLGTFGYMAPEQVRGEHAALDARADVYSLGAILFEILAGEPLHRGSSLSDVAASTLRGRDRSPRARVPACDVPLELDAICVRATEALREDRFASARALADAVERFLEGDRDVALRRAQASELSGAAARSLEQSASHGARIDAGRAAVRALALDPGNAEARRVLVDVVTTEPGTVPEEAAEGAARAQEEGARRITRWYAGGLGAVCVGFAAILFAAGVIDVGLVATTLGLALAACAVIANGALAARTAGPWLTLGFAVLCVANALFTRWLSPFVVVPVVMLVNTVQFTLIGTRAERLVRLGMALLVVIVPVALDLGDAVPHSFEVHPDRIVIFARLAAFPAWLPWMLVAVTGGMLFCAFLVTLMLDHVATLQRRVHVQAWMLRRVVSGEEQPGGSGPTS